MYMYKTTSVFALIIMLGALTGCGTSKTDRALSGSAIGAGIGAVGSSVTGGSTLGGAVVGGVTGGVIGAVTDKDDINLDK